MTKEKIIDMLMEDMLSPCVHRSDAERVYNIVVGNLSINLLESVLGGEYIRGKVVYNDGVLSVICPELHNALRLLGCKQGEEVYLYLRK